MTRAGQARVLTAVALAGLALFVLTRRGAAPVSPAAAVMRTPQDAIYAMLDAARTGDTTRYLDNYSGTLAETLRQSVTEKGEAGFSRYLRATYEPVKGIAVDEPKPTSEREVKVRVELVYQERNESQIYRLEMSGERWRIVQLESAERVRTLVPYGSPAQ